MSLTELSVRRAVTFSMVFLIVVGFGLFSLARLRLDMYPDITFPIIGVVTQYQGAGPQEVEDLITRPIEGTVTAVEGVKEVSSNSKRGVSVVTVEFNWGTDLNQAEIDVRKYLDFVREALPEDADEPIVFAFDPSMQPIVFFGLSGPFDGVTLRRIAEEKIEPMLERLPGVASADTMGGGKREIRIQLDPARLGALGISAQQVVAAVRGDNVTLPGGTFSQAGWEFTVQTEGRFTSVKQVERVVVGVKNRTPVRVRDVAEVIDGLQEPLRLVRNDGRTGIMLMVRKQSDANTVQTVRAVLKAVPEVQRKAGRGLRLATIFNQGEFIEQSIGNLASTGGIAFIMAGLVLLFFLRSVRSSIIVAAAIPISVIATFSAMDFAGLTLNIISMAGLALAIGMLVDNAIVVLENIFSFTEAGQDGRAAAVRGTQEVATAITASTLTTLVVFLPILFVPGIAGKMFGDMAITICFSLAASLFVARTGIPLAASRLLGQRQSLGAVGERGGRVIGALRRIYVPSLRWCLRNRKKTLGLVTLAAGGVIALGTGLKTEFFPKYDQSLIMMQAETAFGTDLEETDTFFRRVEAIIERSVPEREAYNVSIGTGEGFMAMFSKGQHSGIMRIRLKPRDQRRRTQQQIEQDLRRQFAAIPGFSATVLQGGPMGAQGDIVVEIYGHDMVQARQLGLTIKELVQGLPDTADVTFSLEVGRPEYDVKLDRSQLAAVGLTTAAVSSAISVFYAGTLASVYREGGTEYNIRVRGPRSYRRDARDLESLPIVTPSGVVVPLSGLAQVEPAVGPASIARKDQQRMVTVSASVTGRNLGGVLEKLNKKLDAYPWPEGFSWGVTGQAEDFQESFMYLGISLLASILLVYMVMASQFESLLHPFLILFSIPLAFVGVVVALFVTDTSLSVTALIGVLILVGLVVNNAIVLVDTINRIRATDDGEEIASNSMESLKIQTIKLFDAVEEAGRRRLRPILMTAFTTILGMTPMALELGEGSESWSPMARAVIGGLITSTLLTLMVIPTLYTSLESFRLRRRARRAMKKAAPA